MDTEILRWAWEWLGFFKYWLNQNAGAMQALTAFTMLFLTFALLCATKRYTEANEKSVTIFQSEYELRTRPFVAFEWDEYGILVTGGTARLDLKWKLINLSAYPVRINRLTVKLCYTTAGSAEPVWGSEISYSRQLPKHIIGLGHWVESVQWQPRDQPSTWGGVTTVEFQGLLTEKVYETSFRYQAPNR